MVREVVIGSLDVATRTCPVGEASYRALRSFEGLLPSRGTTVVTGEFTANAKVFCVVRVQSSDSETTTGRQLPRPDEVTDGCSRPSTVSDLEWNRMNASQQAAACKGAARVGKPELAVWLFGETGNPFGGSCNITIGTETKSLTLAGVLPAKFTFLATSLDCEFRKETALGFLLVQFVRDGRSIKDSLTRSPFGVVSLSIGR